MNKTKSELRQEILKLRREKGSPALSAKICENIMQMNEYKNAESVALFMPYGSEADISPLISYTLAHKTLYLPVTDENDNISFFRCTDINSLHPGKYGISEPPSEHEATGIDFMLVPGTVFDKKGFRIGYGKGCYDRFLKGKNIFTCAALYSFQLVSDIRHEAHDVAVKALADEKNIFYIY